MPANVHSEVLKAVNEVAFVKQGATENEVEVYERMKLYGDNPHLVKMVASYQDPNDNKSKNLVLENCSGGDLFDYIQSRSFDSSTGVKGIFVQIATGLSAMHNAGVAHRDVSLENILLNANQTLLKLSDYKLACDAHAVRSETVGKGFYMSPQVARGVDYVPAAADVWSLGIVLFILLTGSPPFENALEDDPRYAFLSLNGVQSLLCTFGYDVPKDALNLLKKMLCVEPSKRFDINQVLSHPFCN